MSVMKTWMMAGLLAVAAASPVEARIGLSSQFVDLLLENLEPGRTYNLLELRGIPYTVKNRGDAPVDVEVVSIPTTKKELKEPYEGVPDPGWVRVTPERMRIEPGESGFGALTISIPDEPELVGKHFQAMIHARTVGTGWMAAGVKTRIRFSIGKGPETLAEEERVRAMVNLNYDLWPSALYANKVEPGAYDVFKREKGMFLLTNRDSQALELVAEAAPWRGPIPEGYEPLPDMSWVSFDPKMVKVEPMSVGQVKVHLDIPEKARGKAYAFLVRLSLPIGTIVNQTNRVFIRVDGGAKE